MNLVIVSQAVSRLLRQGPYLARKSPLAYHAFTLITSPRMQNILTSQTDSEYWRATRKATAPAFSNQNLR